MCRARDPQQAHGTNMFRSLKKSGRLKRISKVLGAEVSFDNFVFSLGSETGPKAQALSELFDLCEADPDLSQGPERTRLSWISLLCREKQGIFAIQP
jgi:hypothetical protein